MVYRDTLTEGLVVHVMYTYCQSYCGIQEYSDRGVGSTCNVHVLPELLWYTGILCQSTHRNNTRGNSDIWYISWPSSVSMELHVQL